MSDGIEIKNAVIKKVDIGIERGFVVGINVVLDYGDSSQQGFLGGYYLYTEKGWSDATCGDYTGHCIMRLCEVVGTLYINDIVGKSVRVKGTYNDIHAIGNIIKDNWFNPKQDFDEFKKRFDKRYTDNNPPQ